MRQGLRTGKGYEQECPRGYVRDVDCGHKVAETSVHHRKYDYPKHQAQAFSPLQ